MKQIVSAIPGHELDYKLCTHCGSINWYERDYCHSCGKSRFKLMTKKDGEALVKKYDKPDRAEVEV